MSKKSEDLPQICTTFSSKVQSCTNRMYNEIIENTIKRLLPFGFFSGLGDKESVQDQISHLDEALPLVSWSGFEKAPCNLSCLLLCRFRPNAFKFFFEMISRWLIPGKRLDVVLFFAGDFCFQDAGDQKYTLCEVMIHVENEADLQRIKENLPVLETELRLGTASIHHARRILDIKGLSSDEKTAMIQEQILTLINHRSQDFDHDLLTEMQHFLVVCRSSFKERRESRHMSRIICAHYHFRKTLRKALDKFPDRRQFTLKCMKARLHEEGKIKTVLGVLVGINFLRDNELLEERHLIKAIKNFLPDVTAVEDSFFSTQHGRDPVHTLYLEVERLGDQVEDQDFTIEEIKLLRKELPGDLKNRIEHLMHPIFMPHNEEEIMRNILTLSNQLKFLRDVPQVIISFDEQSDHLLSFTVILLRVLKTDSKPIQEMFEKRESVLTFVFDREKIIGMIRKKHPKEANVFQIKFEKAPFLRADHSLDLYKARQVVVSELTSVVGEFRDFNGGMISKQNELFCALKDLLAGVAKQNEFLLENFFYSLTPVLMRTILEPAPLKELFLMLIDALEAGFFQGANYSLRQKRADGFFYVMITADDPSFREELEVSVASLDFPSLSLASSFVHLQDMPCLGFIYREESLEKAELLLEAISSSLKEWEKETFLHASL